MSDIDSDFGKADLKAQKPGFWVVGVKIPIVNSFTHKADRRLEKTEYSLPRVLRILMKFVEPVRGRRQQIRLQQYVRGWFERKRQNTQSHQEVAKSMFYWQCWRYLPNSHGSVRTQNTCIVCPPSLHVVVAHIRWAGSIMRACMLKKLCRAVYYRKLSWFNFIRLCSNDE